MCVTGKKEIILSLTVGIQKPTEMQTKPKVTHIKALKVSGSYFCILNSRPASVQV